MRRIKELLNIDNGSELKLRFSKSDSQWQVYNRASLLYVGEKEQCRKYLEHMEANAI